MDDFSDPNEKELSSSFKNKIIGNNSMSYLLFIKQLLSENINLDSLTAVEERMILMFHYDLWQKSGGELGINTFADSMNKLQQNPVLTLELKELINYLIEQVDVIEKPLELDFSFPLKLYSRYNRDQILVAMEQHSLEKASSNREGVAVNKRRNSEALFITLKKSDKDYSPTTQYDDYAISDHLFHWQTQNKASSNTSVGRTYIEQRNNGRKILLFVREQNKDEFGYTMNYICLGLANFVKYHGEKPMNIEWKLEEPMPPYIFKESAKLAVG